MANEKISTLPSGNPPQSGDELPIARSGANYKITVGGVLTTPLAVVGNATAGAEIRLPEDTDNGSNYVALKAADSLANNVTFTLPDQDGSNGQVLQTNGSGVLSFTSAASFATPLTVVGNATAGAEIRLPEDTDNGSNYVAVKAPDSLGSNITCTLPTETSTLGYLNVPVNEQSAAYTLVIGDAGKTISHPSTDANARTFTIPANGSVAFPVGTVVSFLNMTSQVVTIAITTDTMYLAGTGATGSRSLAQYGIATAIKMTSTTWLISGNGLT